jgi:DNA-binding CsgD family transcriptional regulator
VGHEASQLSGRELEVAALVVKGRTNREIADALTISARTVQSHIASTMTKLGARSRTELAVRALCGGLVPCPGGRESDTAAANRHFGGLQEAACVRCNAAVDQEGPAAGSGAVAAGVDDTGEAAAADRHGPGPVHPGEGGG